jgi:transposase-like protein
MQKKQQDQSQIKWLSDFIWNIADDRLRDVYVRGKYRDVILPFKYLNNMIEQDHRRIKQRIRPMLGFKRFDSAAVTISGIELVQKIQKHQFKFSTLGGCSATMPELWNAVLAA